MIRISLLQPRELYRQGIKSLLSNEDDLCVTREFRSEIEATDGLEQERPDVLLVDVEQGALSVMRQLSHHFSDLRSLVLTDHPGDKELEMMLRLGVRGFISRDNSSQVLLRAVRAVGRGQSFFCPRCSAALAAAVNLGALRQGSLSIREQLILEQTERGLTIREIAAELSLSPRTVEAQRSGILRKLECRNVMEALRKARAQGLLVS